MKQTKEREGKGGKRRGGEGRREGKEKKEKEKSRIKATEGKTRSAQILGETGRRRSRLKQTLSRAEKPVSWAEAGHPRASAPQQQHWKVLAGWARMGAFLPGQTQDCHIAQPTGPLGLFSPVFLEAVRTCYSLCSSSPCLEVTICPFSLRRLRLLTTMT